MIHTVLFDLDDTLLDFQKAEKIALVKTLTELGIEPGEELLARYSVLNLAQWRRLEKGELTREEVKIRRYRLLFEEIGVTCSAQRAAELYEGYLGIGHYFIDGAEELLDVLSKDYALYLVTNGTTSVQEGRIKSAGIAGYFKDIFISEKIGFNKPGKAFFDCCFAQISDFRIEEAVIVGDSITSDIQGGKNAGIKTVWFNPTRLVNASSVLPDYEIVTLQELPGLLKNKESWSR
ncbi:MAG: YjjG family noncanonical pyrimidine nucleotidase [Lachnospiraceae bacterium]